MAARVPLRKARIQDVRAIHALLLENPPDEGLVLPRSLNQIYSQLRDFYVTSDPETGQVIGCCALNIFWDNLAELRSLKVRRDKRGLGLGRVLVDACLSEAVTLGIYQVFVLTNTPDFFAHLGFKPANKETLPQKVWADCINCPKFPDCDEVPMLLNLEDE